MWGAYNGIAAQGFQHNVVNHQYNFVDPNTGFTTNHVKAMWQRAKARFKSMFGPTNRHMIPDYLTWQSSCGIRDLENILTSTFGLKLPNSTPYKLNGKNKSKKQLF